jgi:hypothetical protein
VRRFDVVAEPLSGLRVVQRHPLADSWGFQTRMFRKEDFEEQRLKQSKHLIGTGQVDDLLVWER